MPDTTPSDALAFVDELIARDQAYTDAHEHVVLVYDPETESRSAVGVFPDKTAALAHLGRMDRWLNGPGRNDGTRILLWAIPIDLIASSDRSRAVE